MSINQLQALKEYQSLCLRASELDTEIAKQEQRITRLQQHKNQQQQQLDLAHEQQKNCQKKLVEIEQFLKKATLELKKMDQHLFDMGGTPSAIPYEQQKKQLEEKINGQEEMGLEQYQLLEQIGQEISKINHYFSNIDQSIKELTEEVEQEIAERRKSQKNINLRCQELFDGELNSSKQAILKALKLHAKMFTAHLTPQGCQVCGMSVPSYLYQQMKQEHLIKACVCGRLLIIE